MTNEALLHMAEKAAENAYAPYSGFAVGAAIEAASGRVYTGCNIENASYPAGICAERTALFKAVSEGEREFSKIAVTSPPCGICRQALAEFGDPDVIFTQGGAVVSERLSRLLPLGFLKTQLNSERKR